MKRASIGVALLIAGFVAGLILTGRLRSAEESTAQTAPRPNQAVAVPAALGAPALPDLTTIASQAVKGVVNISSEQVIRRPNSPFANESEPFWTAVKSRYHAETTIGGMTIYRANQEVP